VTVPRQHLGRGGRGAQYLLVTFLTETPSASATSPTDAGTPRALVAVYMEAAMTASAPLFRRVPGPAGNRRGAADNFSIHLRGGEGDSNWAPKPPASSSHMRAALSLYDGGAPPKSFVPMDFTITSLKYARPHNFIAMKGSFPMISWLAPAFWIAAFIRIVLEVLVWCLR